MSVQAFAPTYKIEIGGQVDNNARLLRLIRSIHPEHVDSAEFELMPRPDLQNVSVQDKFASLTCKVFMDIGISQNVLLHSGIIAGGEVGYSEQGDRFTKHSRLSDEMFGEPLDKILVAIRNPTTENDIDEWGRSWVDGNAVFNPVFDGRVQPNMHKDEVANYCAFIDLDSVPESPTNQKTWTLLNAAWYLIVTLNFGEAHVLNPTYAALSAIINDDKTIFNDVEIPRGVYLPEALRILLTPYGYHIGTTYGTADKPSLSITKRNAGTPQKLWAQPLHEAADLSVTEVHELDITYDRVNSSAKYIRVVGDYERREGTFDLIPGWGAEFDHLHEEPKKLQLGSEYIQTTPGAEFAWRRWVLNEAGDRNDPRGRSVFPWHPNQFFELTPNVIKRRKFLPVILEDMLGGSSGIHDGILIEWYHPEKQTWNSITGFEGTSGYVGLKEGESVEILENECGIFFMAQLPPLQIMAFGLEEGTNQPRVKMRVTASLLGDQRIRYEQMTGSGMINPKVEVIDVPSFKLRVVDETSQFHPVKNTLLFKNTEKDDRQAMEDLAIELADNWGHANVSATVRLIGVEYRLDDLLGAPIDGINGRNIWMPLDTEQTKYPTLMGWEMDYETQSTTLNIGTLRGRTL